MHSSRVLKIECRSLCLESFEKNPSTAFIQEAEVGVKWNVQSGRSFSHWPTSADLRGGDVVENGVDRGSGLDPPGDMVEKGEELLGAVAIDHLAGDLSGGDVEGRHQACGAVAPVVVGAGLGMAGLHRQGPLRPPERLILRLLVHRDDDGVVGRIDVEADDVADFHFEPRVAGDLERLDLVGLQAVALQNAEHRRDGDVQLLRQRSQRPVAGVLRRRRHRELDQLPHFLLRYRLAAPFPGDVAKQAADALQEEAVPPHRQTVGFDMPVAPVVCDRVRPSPRRRTIVALRTCLGIEWGSILILSRRARSSPPETICVLLLFAIPVPLPQKNYAALAAIR